MKRILQTLLTILTIVNLTMAQNELECSIALQDTLMVGQSMYFEYFIHNKTQEVETIYYDPLGQNFNNFRRDESFVIELYDSNNKIIPIKDSKQDEIVAYSRRVGFKELLKGDSLGYVLWVDNWFDLTKAGEYTVKCSKEFRLKSGGKDEERIIATCESQFLIMSYDSIRIANKVHHIWMNVSEKKKEPPLIQINQTRKEFQDRRNQRTQNYNHRQNQLKLLCRLKTKQIIPYLDEIMSSSKSTEDIQLAMEGLSKFNTDKEAFNIISKPFQYEEVRFGSGVTREEILEGLLSNLKHSALHYLSKFDDAFLIPFMLKHQNDKSYSVRLYIMQELYGRNSQYSLDNLKVNLNDNNATIRSEASKLLRMYEREKKE
jgi:hypothetical protein